MKGIINNPNEVAKWFLRFGLAFVFFYASVEIYLHPQNFIKYVPTCMLNALPLDLFLNSFGVIEVALTFWLLSGWKGEYSSIISVVMIIGIVVCNMEHFQVLFRNVAIGFGGLALLVLEMKKKRTATKQVTSKSSLVKYLNP
jgi:hypothetical protein